MYFMVAQQVASLHHWLPQIRYTILPESMHSSVISIQWHTQTCATVPAPISPIAAVSGWSYHIIMASLRKVLNCFYDFLQHAKKKLCWNKKHIHKFGISFWEYFSSAFYLLVLDKLPSQHLAFHTLMTMLQAKSQLFILVIKMTHSTIFRIVCT